MRYETSYAHAAVGRHGCFRVRAECAPGAPARPLPPSARRVRAGRAGAATSLLLLAPSCLARSGWLKTVDEYATGSNNSIQHTNTNLQYDTVMQCLALNPDRKFIAVEQA